MMFLFLLACTGDNIKVDPEIFDTGDPIEAVDLDGDGAAGDVDCDDDDPATHPGAPEVCDEVDNNCDGTVDEGVTEIIYPDLDGDGYGEDGAGREGCPSTATTSNGGDCNDTNASISPAGQEVCDDADQDEDCDGLVDDLDDSTDPASMEVGYLDSDGDGYGDINGLSTACALSADYIAQGDDCDDTDASVNPGGTEVCDPDLTDEDCDGFADDDDHDIPQADLWYPDLDGDGFGDVNGEQAACTPPSGYIADGEDCDDDDAGANPDDGCDWSGTYTGDFTITATFLKALSDTCTGTAEIDVDDSASPQLVGEVACTWGGTLKGIFGNVTGDLEGDFTDTSDAEASLILSTKLNELVPFEFVATDIMEASLSGKGKLLTYDITFDLAR